MAEFISNNDRGYRIRLWLDQVGQNFANNTSQVRVRLALLNNYTTFAEYDCSAFVDINGQRLNWSGRPDMLSYNSTIWLIDTTITVSHNADGKKTIGFMAQLTGSGGYSPGTLNIGGNSFELTTIPRASSVSAGSGTIGSGVTINISRASDSFTHKVRYQWGNTSGDIASNVGTSVTWTIPLTFANEIPNSTSGNGTVFVDTYSGSTLIGTKSTSLTATVPTSMVPTLSGITLSDSNATAGSLVPGNSFVQIISNIKVAFSGAAGTYGSTINGFRAEIVGKNASTTSNGGTLGAMNWTGAATVRAYVTDSRGRQSAARDVTIDVLPYHPPVLSFDIKRVGASSSTLQVIRRAKIAPLKVNDVQKNVLTLTFKVAEVGSTTYTPDNGSANASLTTQWELVNSAANLAGTYIGSKSYVVIGTLSDKFSTVEFKAEIATESVVMSYSRNGVGIGKIWERGSLDVVGDIYAGGKVISGGLEITKTALLNLFYPIGSIYQSTNNTNPSTIMGGMWERFGNGRVLVGVDENDSDFSTSNKTGGAKTHKLTAAEMEHNHIQTEQFYSAYINGSGHKFTIGESVASGTIKTSGVADITNQPHNNLQPYVTLYRWRRTA